jgi:tRNA(Ile)-lysidine synthase
LALAAVTAFEAPRQSWRAGAVIVDHGLLPDSPAVAAAAAEQCRSLGLDPVEVIAVEVDRQAGQGIEAAAREARYRALEAEAHRHGAALVLLAHTLDDQAETVLLAMARGSGARALAGMAPRRGVFARPFLELTRVQTEAIVASAGLEPWQDPTNQPGGPYESTRSQVRAKLMPAAKSALGPGFDRALARTAARIREDQECLDAQGADLLAQAVATAGGAASDPADRVTLAVSALAGAHPAVRRRALRQAALAAGAAAGALNTAQIEAVDRLLADWRGQGPVNLAGRVMVRRKCGKLEFRAFPTTQLPEGGRGGRPRHGDGP